MKIVHVIPALTKGGAERVLVDLANSAVGAGHDVAIIAAVPAPAELIGWRLRPEVTLHYVGGRSIRGSYLRLLPWLLRNRRWIFEQDVVHCHLTFGSVLAAVLQRLRRISKPSQPALVETYHAVGMAIPDRERAMHALLLSGRDAIALMADDPYWRRYADEHRKTIFRIIPNGIAPPEPASAEKVERYRDELTVIPAKRRAVVGTVGRLVPARRPELLLEAFGHAAVALGPEIHLLMGGEGSERVALERAARDRGLAAQVHMPGLVLDPAEPIGLMDLYLTVNVGATTGIAALEAAFLGAPIIALQLQKGYCARSNDWIWSSPDPAAIGAKAVELLNDPAALAELAGKQQAHARAHFSVEAMAQAYDELYETALQRFRKAD